MGGLLTADTLACDSTLLFHLLECYYPMEMRDTNPACSQQGSLVDVEVLISIVSRAFEEGCLLRGSGSCFLCSSKALRLEPILERRNHQSNIGGCSVEPHDANAPHLASTRPKATCNLQVVFAHDIIIEAKPINAFGHLQATSDCSTRPNCHSHETKYRLTHKASDLPEHESRPEQTHVSNTECSVGSDGFRSYLCARS